MGLFDWDRDDDVKEEQPEPNPLYQSQEAYEARRRAFEAYKPIRLHDAEGGAWWLAAADGAVVLFPLHERNGTPKETLDAAQEIRIPLEQADVQRIEEARTPIRTEGIFAVYEKPEVRIGLNVPGHGRMALTADQTERAIPYLMECGLARFRAVYDLVDCTGPVFDIRCSQGG